MILPGTGIATCTNKYTKNTQYKQQHHVDFRSTDVNYIGQNLKTFKAVEIPGDLYFVKDTTKLVSEIFTETMDTFFLGIVIKPLVL